MKTGVVTVDTGGLLTLGVTATGGGPGTGVLTFSANTRGVVETGMLTFGVTGSGRVDMGTLAFGVNGLGGMMAAVGISGTTMNGNAVTEGSTGLSQAMGSGSVSVSYPVCSIKKKY